MLSRKGGVLAVVVVLGGGVAVLTSSWVLALALVAPAAALLLGLVPDLVGAGRLTAEQTLDKERYLEGDTAQATLTIRNDGFPIGLSEISVEPPPGTRVAAGAAAFLARLRGGREARTEYDLKLETRGRHETGPVRVRERGFLGLGHRETELRAPFSFRVMPLWEPLGPLGRAGRPPRVLYGVFATHRAGAGSEFFGLRAYAPGDSMDAVNWKQTAKHSRPIVNEVEHDAIADLVLVLDARVAASVGTGRLSTVEAGVRATVSLSERAITDRYRVGLVILSRDIRWIHAGQGRRQQDRIVEALLDVRPGGEYPLGPALTSAPAHVFPRGARFVLVTAGYAEPALPAAVVNMRARRLDPVVIAVRPETAELAAGVGGDLGAPAARVMGLSRQNAILDLRRAGAQVVEWDVREPLAAALVRAEAR